MEAVGALIAGIERADKLFSTRSDAEGLAGLAAQATLKPTTDVRHATSQSMRISKTACFSAKNCMGA